MTTDISSITSGASTPLPSATSILSFSEGPSPSSEPSPCDPLCELAAYHAMGIGPTPKLCDKKKTPFITAYENCVACIDTLDVSPDDILKPEVRQAMDYCDIKVSFTSKDSLAGAATSSSDSSSEESSATSDSSPSQTSDSDESVPEESSDGGDDDSSGSLMSSVGLTLGGVAGLLHFILL